MTTATKINVNELTAVMTRRAAQDLLVRHGYHATGTDRHLRTRIETAVHDETRCFGWLTVGSAAPDNC